MDGTRLGARLCVCVWSAWRKKEGEGGRRERDDIKESLRDEFVLGERKGRWTEERWMVELEKGGRDTHSV